MENLDIDDPDDVASMTFLSGLNSMPQQRLKLANPEGSLVFLNAIQIGSTNARIALMRQGIGITACLKSTVSAELERGSLVHLLSGKFGFSLRVAIGSPHKRASAASELVAKAIADIHASYLLPTKRNSDPPAPTP